MWKLSTHVLSVSGLLCSNQTLLKTVMNWKETINLSSIMEDLRTGSVCASSEQTELYTEEEYAICFQYIPFVSQ